MHENVSLLKRFAACLYELLSLIAIWLLLTAIFLAVFGQADTGTMRLMLQLFLWIMTGAYFIVCWMRSGQTLAAQAWKVRLLDAKGHTVDARLAALRYVLASVSFFTLGAGFLWAFVDREHLFLHDRILKTRLIKVK